MEHRWGPRRQLDQAIHVWTSAGVAAAGQLTNLSTSGGFVTTSLPVEQLARVTVRLKLDENIDRSKGKWTAEGHVVRIEDDGFAVEWREFSPPAIRALIRIERAQIVVRPASLITSGAFRRSP